MKQSNKLETYGNEVTMNMNNILYQNIQASPYFKQLYEKKTYHEVIDEIYNHVESLEPFLKGTTASTAFCLLYKLWTLRLSVKQVKGLIDHTDSPHIRALGFLYLRYVCKPADLWSWFEPYLDDEEEIQIQGGSRPVIITIGKVARQLLLENKWLGTILPRIPVPIAREIEQKIKEQTKPLPTPQGRQSPSYDNGRRDSPELNDIVRRGVRAETEIEVEIEVGIDIEEEEVIAETGEIETMSAGGVMIMKGKEDMTMIENPIEEGAGVLERMYRL
ncbi:11170_t:CDS:2 [Paraglomus occultum]|uniref:Pre-mRNA-splicing factor 38 n=1 Tax=Paraglomus occultum TaxID=144539 RepID=A0A9N9F9V2_9GLOM|nr:11170_t:CDS:2 [Paraglomus occultum]